MGKVRRINNDPTPASPSIWQYTATNYADLLTKTGMGEGDLAIVYNSQGVWLVNRKLKGVYIYLSGAWEYGNEELQNKIQTLSSYTTAEMNSLTPVVGMKIYNSTLNKIAFYNGSAWEEVTSTVIV